MVGRIKLPVGARYPPHLGKLPGMPSNSARPGTIGEKICRNQMEMPAAGSISGSPGEKGKKPEIINLTETRGSF